jgi:hypothetical protein
VKHRLIKGDGSEKWLPFAESCVTKLKKLGLPYADQSYEIEGASIKVRIEPGNEYIRIEGGEAMYMESGQLEPIGTGDLNPYRLEPEKWHFLDIPTTDKYLGLCEPRGRQKNRPTLSEGMDSKAIGYPKVYVTGGKTQDEVDAANLILANTYSESTINKKLAYGFFPASVYSGKMRRFMQAVYGATETIDKERLVLEVVGLSANLSYSYNGVKVPLFYRVHSSCGIVVDSLGGYWLTIISALTSDDLYTVVAYPFKMSGAARAFDSIKKSASTTEENKKKLESYIFANGYFDTTKPLAIGEFSAPLAQPIAYGWKWSETTNTASVVVHRQVGTGVLDNQWLAYTIHAVITITINQDSGVASGTVSSQVVSHGAWTDSDTRTYNIFSPVTELHHAPLELWTLGLSSSGEIMPEFNFSDVSVYGYYVGDVWTPCVVSRDINAGPWPTYEQDDSGILYSPALSMSSPNRYQYGYALATQEMSYHSLTKYGGTLMTVSVGSVITTGESTYGSHRYMTKEIAHVGSENNSVIQNGTSVGSPGYIPGDPPGWTYSYAYVIGATTIYGNVDKCLVTITDATWTGFLHRAWVLVIPGGDCAAAYVGTRTAARANTVFSTIVRSGYGITRFFGDGGSFVPWSGTMDGYNGWFGILPVGETVVMTATPPAGLETKVIVFNSELNGVDGVQGGSYTALFDVDYSYPYYDRGMYTYTSSGGRYAMSEHPNSPLSANFQYRFVGWA